jgi:hypothetical protein
MSTLYRVISVLFLLYATLCGVGFTGIYCPNRRAKPKNSMYNQMIFVGMLWYNLRLAQQSLPE